MTVVQIVHKARIEVSGTTTVSVPSVAPGSLLVLVLAWFDAAGGGLNINVVTDDKDGGSWSTTTGASGDTSSHVRMYYRMNATGGTTVVTIDPSDVGDVTIEGDVLEVSGMQTSAVLDKDVAASGSDNTADVTTGTLAQADELVIMVCSHTGADLTGMAHDSGDGYTEISKNLDNDTGQTYESQYKLTAAVTSHVVTCTFTGTASGNRAWFAHGASFKGLAASIPVIPGVPPAFTRSRLVPVAYHYPVH